MPKRMFKEVSKDLNEKGPKVPHTDKYGKMPNKFYKKKLQQQQKIWLFHLGCVPDTSHLDLLTSIKMFDYLMLMKIPSRNILSARC